ncbi:MAG: transcriptional repressor [Clostridia bacterium]|nr:transcriptional repressor [Clostridia bacterium]
MDSAKLLADHSIKPSIVRVMIYDFLRTTKSHPTVDDIYREIHPKVPTLSKTTVYNTVKLFVSSGLIKALSIDGTQIRYDADIGHHGHFKCDLCCKVYDFHIGSDSESGLEGFEVETREIFYTGKCKECI